MLFYLYYNFTLSNITKNPNTKAFGLNISLISQKHYLLNNYYDA